MLRAMGNGTVRDSHRPAVTIDAPPEMPEHRATIDPSARPAAPAPVDVDRFVKAPGEGLRTRFDEVAARYEHGSVEWQKLTQGEVRSLVRDRHQLTTEQGRHRLVADLLFPDRGEAFSTYALRYVEREYGLKATDLFDAVKSSPALTEIFVTRFGSHMPWEAQREIASAVALNGRVSERCLIPLLLSQQGSDVRVREIATAIVRNGEMGLDQLLGEVRGTPLEKTIIAQQFDRHLALAKPEDRALIDAARGDATSSKLWSKYGVYDADIEAMATGKNPASVTRFIKKALAGNDPDMRKAAAHLLIIEGKMAQLISAYSANNAESAAVYDKTALVDLAKAEALIGKWSAADIARDQIVQAYRDDPVAALRRADALPAADQVKIAAAIAPVDRRWFDPAPLAELVPGIATGQGSATAGRALAAYLYAESKFAWEVPDATSAPGVKADYTAGFEAWFERQMRAVYTLPQASRDAALDALSELRRQDKRFRLLPN